MTNIDTFAPRLTTLPRIAPAHSLTIFLGRTLNRPAAVTRPAPATTTPPAAALPPVNRPTRSSLRALTAPDAGAGGGILLGLAVLTVPAVIYSLAQLAGLIGGGTLEQAIRAFLP